MTLKPQLDKAPAPVTPPLSWGVLAEPGEMVGVVRFECEDGGHSYPYHTLSRWTLRAGQPEHLVIQAGRDKITVRGRDLSAIREALDAGCLRVLRAVSARYGTAEQGTIVAHIEVKTSEDE
jgi:hypothetical protein